MKLLVLNSISPFAALLYFFFLFSVLVSDVVLHVTAPCYLSPASLCPACLHLSQACPKLPVSVSSVWLSECVSPGTAASFCTCKGCVFALVQGQ